MSALQIFSARVPRYTSYPTAPHFHGGVDAAKYHNWLEELPEKASLSIYLHVPFCDTLCWFCACHTSVTNSYAPVRSYAALLEREIQAVAAILKGRHPVRHIHWGGGSPTMLAQADMAGLVRLMDDAFGDSMGRSMAVEIDPRGFDASHADMLATCGMTRASIGLQDSDPKVQKAINRIQPDSDLKRTVMLLRERGINDVNFDLVYGLPFQTPQTFERTLDFALGLRPRRVAIFGYAHVPHFKKHQALISEAALPSLGERLVLAQQAEYSLRTAGYQPVGLDHFALPEDEMAQASRDGSLRRNFQGYSVDEAPALIGFGASAISALPQAYIQNVSTVREYRRMLDMGLLPVGRGIELSPEDLLRRDIIEKLMCFLQVDVGAACFRHGFKVDALDQCLDTLETLRAEGAVLVSGRQVTISRAMRPAVRLACAAFDAYLDEGAMRHSLSA